SSAGSTSLTRWTSSPTPATRCSTASSISSTIRRPTSSSHTAHISSRIGSTRGCARGSTPYETLTMSLIWPATEADIVTNAPRLHALVIAVANYPHLNGGGGAPALEPLGLSQITTPRYTGLAIADWLLTRYQNLNCRLGSVEVLLSPGGLVNS